MELKFAHYLSLLFFDRDTQRAQQYILREPLVKHLLARHLNSVPTERMVAFIINDQILEPLDVNTNDRAHNFKPTNVNKFVYLIC